MTPHWIYETDEAGNGHRCHYDGTDWHVLVECRDGNQAASSAPFRTDAVTKARMKLGLPVYALTTQQPVDELVLAQINRTSDEGGPKCRGEPIPDPVAILHRAIHDCTEARGQFIRKLMPRWEWALAGLVLAMFAIVAWVHAR